MTCVEDNLSFIRKMENSHKIMEIYFFTQKFLNSISDPVMIQPTTEDPTEQEQIYQEYTNKYTERSLVNQGVTKRFKMFPMDFVKHKNLLNVAYDVLVACGRKEKNDFILKTFSNTCFFLLVENGTLLVSCDTEDESALIASYVMKMMQFANDS